MPFTAHATEIPDVLLLDTKVFPDARGSFMEVFVEGSMQAMGIEAHFVQDNLSVSSRGTLRGLHYQLEPHGMPKLVRVISGAVYDVAVDIRRGSPTFGQWVGQTLSAENARALWIPSGFAHGFQALEPNTHFLYKCGAAYAPDAERAIRYDDPALNIPWPVTPAGVSDRDAAAPAFKDAEYNFEYVE
jgi:dTDP-4-dehydrorhamnose 3,5-epimerase